MVSNLKRPSRNKLLISAALLVILSAVLIIWQREKNKDSHRDDQVVTTRESARQSSGDGFDNQHNAATENKTRLSEDSQLQLPNLAQKYAAMPTLPERSSKYISANSLLMETRLVYKVDPVYPEAAKSTGLGDVVVLKVTINEEGAVFETDIVRGNEVFAEAAVAAVSQWLYDPLLIDGMPTPASFSFSVTFRPDETVRIGSIQVDNLTGNYVNFITDGTPDVPVQAEPIRVGTFLNHDGRDYYSVTSEMSAPVIRVDKQRLWETAYAGWANDDSLKDLFKQQVGVLIFINENGSVDGIRQVSGPRSPALEKELMNLRIQSPAGFGGKAVESWFLLTMDVPDYIK